ncbi:Arc family DNA-binding protein [Falsiroseomonas sp.]|uniref:Arc family DNA-binding protein n=1 Tax=Falsiroseomonas sp. TaxID=2870721 RepID=UPI00271A3615|nr:Arc family DNA-binding protein [Falsiroseomonas sp.]MDO9502148.1 Arc family DNA-binding protein [Falsiroseomonas sp.]
MTDEPKYPSQMQERFIVRLPDGMRDRIAAAAKAGGRSMNAEIVLRLEQSFAEEKNAGTGDSGDLSKINDKLDRIAYLQRAEKILRAAAKNGMTVDMHGSEDEMDYIVYLAQLAWSEADGLEKLVVNHIEGGRRFEFRRKPVPWTL